MNRMKSMFTGAIALVAGVALSAGSAFATKGYVGGDPAMMKLVPYYETGDTKATIIGIQNMSPQEQSTMDLNADVEDIKSFLAGEAANANAAALIGSLVSAGDSLGTPPDLNEQRAAEAALEKAEMAAYTEHLFILVNVYDEKGMMMDDASATLCLAEHQFGYVVLQGMSDMMTDSMQGAVLSVMDEEIPAYGYVKVMAEPRKFTGCGATAPNTLRQVKDGDDDDDIDSATSMVSTWAIIQDTGTGFFGTEVLSATISMRGLAAFPDPTPADTTDNSFPAKDPVLACYSGAHAEHAANTEGTIGNRTGDFMMSRCGLIPERHDNSRITAVGQTQGNPDYTVTISGTDEAALMTARAVDGAAGYSATPRANAFARYDIGDESMVVVWLAEGMDTDDTKPSERRMLDVTVKCEDGTVMMDEDVDGKMMPFKVAAPGMLTMIDPSMGDLGMATMDCEGDRGVLKITMPDKSTAGMVFTHITQMEGHYRMNFPGYSMADPMTCFEIGDAAGGTDADGALAEGAETTAAINACK